VRWKAVALEVNETPFANTVPAWPTSAGSRARDVATLQGARGPRCPCMPLGPRVSPLGQQREGRACRPSARMRLPSTCAGRAHPNRKEDERRGKGPRCLSLPSAFPPKHPRAGLLCGPGIPEDPSIAKARLQRAWRFPTRAVQRRESKPVTRRPKGKGFQWLRDPQPRASSRGYVGGGSWRDACDQLLCWLVNRKRARASPWVGGYGARTDSPG
jgi:hypothetical protein